MLRVALSFVFWSFFAASSVVFLVLATILWAVTTPFDKRGVVLHWFTSVCASVYTWLNPAWPLEIEGRDRIDRDQTYVMVANHLSTLDIPLLFRLFVHFKWVSKIELFRIPVIGWFMTLNRYIKLTRGNRASVERMMSECERVLGEGSSIMMFPEGKRSSTGDLQEFKTGAFQLALSTCKPILPIVIQGTGDALPKRGLVLQGRHPLRLTVLDPIPYCDFAGSSVEELTQRARDRFVEHLAEKRLARADSSS